MNLLIDERFIRDPNKELFISGKKLYRDKYIQYRFDIINDFINGDNYGTISDNYGLSNNGVCSLIYFYLNEDYINVKHSENKHNNYSRHTTELNNYLVSIGKSNFLSKNLVRDERGCSVSHTKGNYTKVSQNNHPLQLCNRLKDENGLDIYSSKGNYTRVENGTNPLLKQNRHTRDDTCLRRYGTIYVSFGYWSRTRYNQDIDSIDYVSDGRIYEHNRELYLRTSSNFKNFNRTAEGRYGSSYPELLLGDLLFKLTINSVPQYEIFGASGRRYYADYYLPDSNLILECDGMFKWDIVSGKYVLRECYVTRAVDIESNSNIKVINIPSDFIYFMSNNLDKLYYIIKEKKLWSLRINPYLEF